jgi:hypothetical protein
MRREKTVGAGLPRLKTKCADAMPLQTASNEIETVFRAPGTEEIALTREPYKTKKKSAMDGLK